MAAPKNSNGWDKWKINIIYRLEELKGTSEKLDSTVSNLGLDFIALKHEIESIKVEIQRRVTRRSTLVAAVSGGVITLLFNLGFEYIR